MTAHPLMIPLRGLYGQPRDFYQGEFRPALAVAREPARLLHYRPCGGAVLASLDDAGTLRLLRLESADHPELDRLNDADRATLQAAVMTMHRQNAEGRSDD